MKTTAVAAEHVKRLADSEKTAQFAASLFADYFAETEPGFDPDEFFRACAMSQEFITSMAKARGLHDRKTLDEAWRVASRAVRAGR